MGVNQSYMYDPYWQQYFNNYGILGGASTPLYDVLQQYRWNNRNYYGGYYPNTSMYLNNVYNDPYTRQLMYLQQPYYTTPLQSQPLYQASNPYYYSPMPHYFY
ncbi:hypothetical protein MUCCIDRAFT_116171 [Mucor lusitanicus CBS 277.49]|uniref:Uncharacterized protein n=1 Tax=Mucor lusitanicus CBS 277.49 TaxID=747725 RepID=A0A168GH93_MUCCL|nr:hypothetical protein MUCCIDRAFT_116171 [Mucor lusitanicus CBS 277.49]